MYKKTIDTIDLKSKNNYRSLFLGDCVNNGITQIDAYYTFLGMFEKSDKHDTFIAKIQNARVKTVEEYQEHRLLKYPEEERATQTNQLKIWLQADIEIIQKLDKIAAKINPLLANPIENQQLIMLYCKEYSSATRNR